MVGREGGVRGGQQVAGKSPVSIMCTPPQQCRATGVYNSKKVQLGADLEIAWAQYMACDGCAGRRTCLRTIQGLCDVGLRSHSPKATIVLSFVATREGPHIDVMFFKEPPPGPVAFHKSSHGESESRVAAVKARAHVMLPIIFGS